MVDPFIFPFSNKKNEHYRKFVISLDFELFCGMKDHLTFQNYGRHVLGVQEELPKMIKVLETHQVKGTFATVGFLFASNKEDFSKYFPIENLQYASENLSSHNGHFDLVGDKDISDIFHFNEESLKVLGDLGIISYRTTEVK